MFTADLARVLCLQLAVSIRSVEPSPPVGRSRIVVKRGLDFVSLALDQVAFFTAEHELVTLVDR